jgi:CheY-like chemotaxis protein
MPGMNGWQLARRLRENGQTAPIVMLSANIGDGSRPPAEDDAQRRGGQSRSTSAACSTSFRRCIWPRLDLRAEDRAAEDRGADAAGQPRRRSCAGTSRLGEIGYVRGIEAKLADLADGEENQPLRGAPDLCAAISTSGSMNS